MISDLRTRICNGELLIGTFIKTPSPHIVEILGYSGIDFAVIDQEHAPIEFAHIDMMALAGRSVGLPLLSRRWGETVDWISPLLDLGLSGVMVPHVSDLKKTKAVCDAVRFYRQKRGLSPSPRAGNYGTINLADYQKLSDTQNVIMLQIEDQEALEYLDEITSVPDIDLLFIGPADLSQSLGVDYPSPELDIAIHQIINAGKKADIAIGLFVNDYEHDIPKWHALGITVFVCASDQTLLRTAAKKMLVCAKSGKDNSNV